MRVALDTQVWVRAFLNERGPCGRVVAAIYQEQFSLITADALYHELLDVLLRPKLARKHRQSPETVAAFAERLRAAGVTVELSGRTQICRDPDDNVLIEAAERGGADYLVTDDLDLQTAEVRSYLTRFGVQVLTIHEFLFRLASPGERPPEEPR